MQLQGESRQEAQDAFRAGKSNDFAYIETLEEFKLQNPAPSGQYYVTTNDIEANSDCYKTWWQSYLGEFEK
mgnify:CR=1 FL=1